MWEAVIIQNHAVSIVHRDFKHGFISLGWDGEYKQTIYSGIPDFAEIYELSYKEVEELGYRLDKKEFERKQKEFQQYKKEMLDFYLSIAKDITKEFNKKYPNGLPSFED